MVTRATRYLAPAKLNLFLHINGRRADGYHELQTLFQFIDLADELEIEPTTDTAIQLQGDHCDVAPEQNLIVRAARLLQTQTQTSLGAHITLHKRLPMGGGIGGGSSDAATTLLVLNRLWETNLSIEQLALLGRRLGADVPVFIRGHAAFAEGIGEQLTDAEPDECWYLLLTPPVHVATAFVFNHPELVRNTPKYNLDQLNCIKTTNDCQTIVSKTYPEVAQALQWLVEYAPARMTGTGSCVFAPFVDERQARAALQLCPTQFAAKVCRGVNHSPLHQQLQQLGLL
ncbi:4-(cytidine 5'-diphospho)-2-C-methyl-D-erythritol kinase [Celerinatantimonas sp. YJH-8]|uniref:4-(cytidine 5'-diphospho)-2-C-methyl-D-erythritol kinase n=1 Tax=Celerinatantimonas sp. YJH-8 TaxID=3228714 RepID=UPI0038C8B638